MSTIAELQRQDANICRALLKATQEMQQYSTQIANLQDPRTADRDKFDQLKITCEAIQEYLIRHREKLQACLAKPSVLVQEALPAVPDLSLANLSLSVGEEKPRISFGDGSSSIAPPCFSLTPATSTSTTTSAPALQPLRLSLLSAGAQSSEQNPRLSLNPQPSSKPYLNLSGNPPSKSLRLSSNGDVAK